MLGLGVIGDGLIPAAHTEEKDAAAERAGALAVRLAENGTTSRRFLDRRALENAMAGAVASGGSTNSFLHLLAIASEAGVPLSLDELAAISASTPVLADLVPGGRFVASDLHAAGGTATLIRELIRGGHVDGGAPTVDGRTLAEATVRRARAGRRGARRAQAARLALRAARQPRSRGLRDEARGHGAARASRAGARVRQRGGVRRGAPRRRRRRGRRARRPLRGPRRRARDARDARRHLGGGRAPGSASRSRSSPTGASPAPRGG